MPKLHLEWGANAPTENFDTTIIVDCLCFSTTATIAVSKGIEIIPVSNRSIAQQLALKTGLKLAGKRSQGGLSLSPKSFALCQELQPVILASPNGAKLSTITREGRVLLGCYRNAPSFAKLNLGPLERVLIIAAGEQWSDGSFRPAFEDYFTAGAIIKAIGGQLSPEARGALAIYNAACSAAPELMLASISGQELSKNGYQNDVIMAAKYGANTTIPQLFLKGATEHPPSDLSSNQQFSGTMYYAKIAPASQLTS
ncbi:2-phosphosulfolactate phosphatase [Polycladidibacter stylochi]|uniref:2-phosphosulfolactate phosphatase n=1 Tax=Polycladidibacter stylochi TaxID=1807766 RepID=UPI00082F0233|nr:2-phosphosulfolactate phosphatase [Pseudovibrio stylochi]